MTLSYFNSYFEILAGINLGYAVFNYFRNELANKVFKIDSSSKLENLKSRFKSQLTEKENNEGVEVNIRLQQSVGVNGQFEITKTELKQKEPNDEAEPDVWLGKLKKANTRFKIKETQLEQEEQDGFFFFEVLKPISFLLALLCMTYLVVSGFQDEASDTNKILYSNYFFTLTCFSAVFSFSIFFCSYAERVIKHKITLGLNQTIIAFFIMAGLSCTSISNLVFHSNTIKLVSLIILPILLFLLFIARNAIKLKIYKERKKRENISCFFTLCLESGWFVLKYILILGVAFLPVIIFRHIFKYTFTDYMVILSTPLFLFIAMAIRAYSHSKKFNKKYSNLAVQETAFLEAILDGEEED